MVKYVALMSPVKKLSSSIGKDEHLTYVSMMEESVVF